MSVSGGMESANLNNKDSEEAELHSLHLSTELLVLVLCHLDFRDLWACRSVSARFKEVVDNTPELQYHLETRAAGYSRYKLVQNSDRSIQENLVDFRKAQCIWRDPKLERLRAWTAPVPFDHFDVFGNVVVGFESDSNDILIVYMEAQPRLERLTFNEPLSVRGVDTTQDLLLVVSVNALELRCLKLLSLDNGYTHPLAQKRSIDETFLGGVSSMNHSMDVFARMCVLGDWLTFEVGATPNETTFYLCHWPTGEIRAQWASDDEVWYQHAYLSSDHILLSKIQLSESQPYIDVYPLYSFSSSSSDYPTPSSFELPQLDHVAGEYARYFSFPTHRMDCRLGRDGRTPDTSLLRIVIKHPSSTLLFVPLSVLLVPTEASPGSSQRKPRPWTTWGPENARISTGVPLTVSGMRVIFKNVIWDFNQWDAMKDAYGPDGRSSSSLHRAVEMAPKQAGLQGNVSTSLPFRAIPLVDEDSDHLPDSPPGWMYVLHDESGPKLIFVESENSVLRLHFFAV